MDASIDCLPGVFVFRFSMENLEVAHEVFERVRVALEDNNPVIGIPSSSSLEYLTKEQLIEVRNLIDKYIEGSE